MRPNRAAMAGRPLSSILLRGAMGLGTSLAAALPAVAADYYAGKTIDFIVSNDVGGGFDIYGRAIARHLGRHIPGNPTVVVKNMPGAGGARGGQYISTVAAKDGLTIGSVMPGTIIGPLLDEKPNTAFDPTKAAYLGAANNGTYLCATLDHSKTKTFEQALTQKTIMGGIATGNSTNDITFLVKNVTGARLEVIPGYKGTAEIALAVERGELDGICGWNWSSAKSQKPDWIRERRLNFLAQIGLQANDELTKLGAPEIWQYIKGEEQRKITELVVSQQAFERPYLTAQGVAPELVALLRNAFSATMRDPQFLADAEKTGIDIAPLPGAELEDLVQRVYATPKQIVEKAKTALKP